MWISRSDYNSLLERITKLEAVGSQNEITYGHYHHWFIGQPKKDEFLPHGIFSSVYGEPVSVRELICLIANHLGFTYQPKTTGKLAAPKAPEVKSKK